MQIFTAISFFRCSLWMCTFSLAVAIGAALLLPVSIASNEVLLLYPNSYYVKWLNSSLIQGKVLCWIGLEFHWGKGGTHYHYLMHFASPQSLGGFFSFEFNYNVFRTINFLYSVWKLVVWMIYMACYIVQHSDLWNGLNFSRVLESNSVHTNMQVCDLRARSTNPFVELLI